MDSGGGRLPKPIVFHACDDHIRGTANADIAGKMPLIATPIKAPGRLLLITGIALAPQILVQPAPRSSTNRADGVTFSTFTPRMSATIFCNFSQTSSSVICCLTAIS